MSDFREEEKLGKLYDSQLTRRLMQYLHPYRLQVIVAVSFTLGITAMELAGPYLFAVGIGKYIVPGFEGTITRAAALTGLLRVALEYAGSILGELWAAVRAGPHHAVDRATDDVRPAQRDF